MASWVTPRQEMSQGFNRDLVRVLNNHNGIFQERAGKIVKKAGGKAGESEPAGQEGVLLYASKNPARKD